MSDIETFSTGLLEENRDDWVEGETGGIPWVETNAVLFYAGNHNGSVYTEKDIDQIVKQFKAPTGDHDWDTPNQLDHSDSARDTIGHHRKVWRDGKDLKARLRWVGEEAVRGIKSGLWKKLSVGIYAREKKLRETSVTPFPRLAGTRTYSESREKDMAVDAAVTTDAATLVESFEEGGIEALRAEFSEKTQRQQEQLDAQAKIIKEQGAVIRFTELTKEVDTFTQSGKTLPVMREAELALLETFSDEQLALFRTYKEVTPKLVSTEILGSQNPEDVDEYKESLNEPDVKKKAADLASKYFTSHKKEEV